jgi:hypothetical protein
MLAILARHDTPERDDSGLSFEAWRSEVGLPTWLFDRKIHELVRSKSVYLSPLDKRYHLEARCAEQFFGCKPPTKGAR